MNNYEEVYKYKREHSESLSDEFSSLNNNYSVDAISENPDHSPLFEESNCQDMLEFELLDNDFGKEDTKPAYTQSKQASNECST
jgi:hypothetical protein